MTKQNLNTSTKSPVVEDAANDPAHSPGHALLTREVIEGRMLDAIGSLALAFTQLEDRRVIETGTGEVKYYPLDSTIPGDATDTGDVKPINVHSFIARDLLDAVCWKLGAMVEKKDTQIATYRSRIRGLVMDRQTPDAVQVDILERQLERAIEQRAVVSVAYQAAREGYGVEVGEAYESKAEREARQQAMRKAAPKSDRIERLRALGVEC